MDKKSRYSLRGWPIGDYLDYAFSVGTICGIAVLTNLLALLALIKHIPVPQMAYAIPIGFFIFSVSWFFDGIAHRSIYKNVIDRGEFVIHDFMTYYSGFPLFICFVLAYWIPALMLPFIFGFAFNKTMYSIYDEVYFHQRRFQDGRSDKIEMSAHSFQFLANCAFDFAWIYWIYWAHYQGAGELISRAISLFH